ncbi:MAG: exopolysaccharide biosynthesis protein [Pseudomonadota bacterium]
MEYVVKTDPSQSGINEGALHYIARILDPTTRGTDAPMSMDELVKAMEGRAFGLVFLALALPCCLPFVYILPQIVAFPMIFLCGQMALGRQQPWLPDRLATRTFDPTALSNVVNRGSRWFGWVEVVAHARFRSLSSGIGQRIVGALLAIPCASILLPLPLTNTVPGFGVVVAAFGLVERDGLLIVAGIAIGIMWVAALAIGGGAAISLLTGWLGG